MNVSDLRKQIVRALDEARKDAAARRQNKDKASAAYERFLAEIAVPVFRQAATVLSAERQPFAVNTPAGSLRLASEHAAEDFLELELDASGPQPQVIGRTSLTRGRRGLVVEERPIAPGKAIEELTEEDVSQFVVTEIRKLVTRA